MSRKLLTSLTIIGVAGCATEPAATVQIVAPRHGAIIQADSVRVVLSASGIEIVAADGQATPGRAHHHVILDNLLPATGQPIPGNIPGMEHLGTGDSVIVFRGLEPGGHRLIAVLALGNHVPIDPWVVDTVEFSTLAPSE
jgi:hypothetical protein